MATLAQILLAPGRRERVSGSLALWIDRYVASRGGLKGIPLKAGLAALKAVRPDALTRGVDRLMPEVVAALEPLFQQCCAANEKDFGKFLRAHLDESAAAIMGAIDARAAASASKLVPLYRRLRGTIEGELRATLPKLVDRIGAVATSEE
jgi:hypothetical protein